MKKLFAVLMMCVMLAAMPFAAMAQEENMPAVLQGFVTEIVENGFVMEDTQQGEVMLNTSDATVFDGVLLEGELSVGQYVFVEYDGRMTFSLPPQAHADRVAAHMLTGSVMEVLEDNAILMQDDVFGETIVQMTEEMGHVYAGMPIVVYYDGVMTLSLPGQVNASAIVLPELSGTVSEKTEEGFVLTDADGIQYQVQFAEDTLISEEIMPVETEELPEEEMTAEETAEEETVTEEQEEVPAEEETVETEISEEESAETLMEDAELAEEIVLPAAELLSESEMEWADGDTVTVYYNGMMSRSIPAQITAMEIVVKR